MPIGRSWAGRMFGTSIGPVSANLEQIDDVVTGTIRANLEGEGLVVLQARGTFNGTELRLHLVPTANQAPPQPFTGELVGRLQPDGVVTGNWQTSLGGGGPFELHPHVGPYPTGANRGTGQAPTDPRALHSPRRNLGWMRMGRSEIVALLQSLQTEFGDNGVTVTLELNGVERTIYAADFALRTTDVPVSRMLRINAQKPDVPGFQKTLNIDMGKDGNTIRAQSTDEQWAVGITQNTYARLRRAVIWTPTLLSRTGVLFLMYLAVLQIWAPELDFWERVAFVVGTLASLRLTSSAFGHFLPQAEVYPTQDRIPFSQKALSVVGTTLIAMSGPLLVGLALALVKGEWKLPFG